MIDRLLLKLLLFSAHALGAQPTAPSPVEAPLRELTWGRLNFLHTTDTHGWHAGHLQESVVSSVKLFLFLLRLSRPSYSADWGDYISFATRMRQKAEADGADLLLIDTGDRVEGNGLYDASEPKGEYTFNIFKEQHIDIICSGNHELYKQNSSENEFTKTVPAFKDSYLASNLDIFDPETGDFVPLAPRYKKFKTTKQGIRILAFGFLYDFTGNYNNTVVQPVKDTIKEDWFQEAIRDRDVDLFVVIGHVPLRSPEFNALFKAIREVQWDTPIQFFGGHTHIRDFNKYDSKSHGLESGRFMETIGFLSIDGLPTGGKQDPKATASYKVDRRYIDNNLFSFHHHSGHNETTFATDHGKNVSQMIKSARKSLGLDHTFGCATRDLWMNRAKYPSNSSIYTWLEELVLPDVIEDPARANKTRLVVINTGGIRFDIFKGPFTRDSTFIVSPFTSGFRYVKDVPYDKAKKLLAVLNNAGQIFESSLANSKLQGWMLAPPEQRFVYEDFEAPAPDVVDRFGAAGQTPLLWKKPNLTPGYTTKDDAGSNGDDTLHSPISFYRVPNCIQSIINGTKNSDVMDDEDGDKSPEVVDVVYIEFIEPWMILAFKFVGLGYTVEDTDVYMNGTTITSLLADWVQDNWKDNCKKDD